MVGIPVLAIAIGLAGCTSSSPVPPAAVTVTAAPSATPSATPSASPTAASPSATPSRTTTAAGRPANGSSLPADAVARTVGDLDGDGRPDRIFAAAKENSFGLATATGWVDDEQVGGASPDPRTAWVARIAGCAVALLSDDGREATLYSLQRPTAGRVLEPVDDLQDKPYTFLDQQPDGIGSGSGAGCRREDGQVVLGGWDVHTVGKDRVYVGFTPVSVIASGTAARNGTKQVLATSTPDTSALAKSPSTGCLGATEVHITRT